MKFCKLSSSNFLMPLYLYIGISSNFIYINIENNKIKGTGIEPATLDTRLKVQNRIKNLYLIYHNKPPSHKVTGQVNGDFNMKLEHYISAYI